MRFYLAPLEGITGYIFRGCIHRQFGEGIDKYFTPFIVPHDKKPMSSKEINDINPDNNKGMDLVPQIMTNKAEDYLKLEKAIMGYGYKEININLGCPSKTVVSKGRGSGFLEYTEKLDQFLYEIYAHTDAKVSVKTRIGVRDVEEFYEILEIYNKYPLEELIVHPRLQKEMYSGRPHLEMYEYAAMNSSHKLCYNGDINSASDYEDILDKIPCPSSIMIGRGMLSNPGLITELATGKKVVSSQKVQAFLEDIRDNYCRVFSGEVPVLHKLKEIWTYLGKLYPDSSKEVHKLLKCRTMAEYLALERTIL